MDFALLSPYKHIIDFQTLFSKIYCYIKMFVVTVAKKHHFAQLTTLQVKNQQYNTKLDTSVTETGR